MTKENKDNSKINNVNNINININITKDERFKLKLIALYKNVNLQQTIRMILADYTRQFESNNKDLFKFKDDKQSKLQ